jgi:hypothetical protein
VVAFLSDVAGVTETDMYALANDDVIAEGDGRGARRR